jgi:hypothetical protein
VVLLDEPVVGAMGREDPDGTVAADADRPCPLLNVFEYMSSHV